MGRGRRGRESTSASKEGRVEVQNEMTLNVSHEGSKGMTDALKATKKG